MKKVLFSLGICLLLQGCQSSPDFLGKASQDQRLITNDSASKILSEQTHTAAVEVDKYINGVFDKPAFKVVVMNQNTTPLTISTENIQVFVDGQPVALIAPSKVQAERLRTANHLESKAGNRGTRSLNGAPDSGNLPSNISRNGIYSPNNARLTQNYRSFISSQLDTETLAPNQIYAGYVTLGVDTLSQASNIKVIMNVDSEEHIFNIVRS
ncbi:hypothetical protein [Aliiglaciecola litoralis]|uniref:Lipoprotein n=1 Tax=Aliiglaciecola litoralis TaxID=582857 RepID=A0ABP3X3R0_9ALTE